MPHPAPSLSPGPLHSCIARTACKHHPAGTWQGCRMRLRPKPCSATLTSCSRPSGTSADMTLCRCGCDIKVYSAPLPDSSQWMDAAVQIRAICQGSRTAFAQLIQGPLRFKPRLLLVSSGNNKLMELAPLSGELLRSVPVRKPAKRLGTGASGWCACMRRALSYEEHDLLWQCRAHARCTCRWPTMVQQCPYDGDLYACQYAVRRITPCSTCTACACSMLLRSEQCIGQLPAGEVCAPL